MNPPDKCAICCSPSDTLVRCLFCSFWVCPECMAYDGTCTCYECAEEQDEAMENYDWDDDEEDDDDD